MAQLGLKQLDSVLTGSLQVSGSVGVTGSLDVDTNIVAGNRVTADYGTINYSLTVNESGNGGGDFRVESDNNPYQIFSDANTDKVGIGTNSLTSLLTINGDVTATHVTASGNVSIVSPDLGGSAGVANPTDGKLIFSKIFDNSGEATANKIVLYSDEGVGPQWQAGIGISTSDFDLFSGDNFRFWTNHGTTTEGDERFTILANGNVGISTDAPDYTLDVAGTVGIDSYIYHNGDGDTYLKFATDEVNIVAGGKSVIKLTESGTNDKIKINNTNADIDLQVMADDGNVILHTDAATNRVGINTDSPTYALDVAGDAGFDEYIYHNGDVDTYIQFGVDQIDFVVGAANMIYLNEGGAGDQADKVTINNDLADVDFQVKGDNEANLIRTVASTDRVGIGTATPDSTLHVWGTISGSDYGGNVSGSTTSTGSFGRVETGVIVANTYIVSSSVTNISIATLSGSTEFGDSADDTHTFTGHITASGNINTTSGRIFEAGSSVIDHATAMAIVFGG
jgi:hypothetical protein